MTVDNLRKILIVAGGVNDFELLLLEKEHDRDYGYYYPNLKKIEIYTIDDGKRLNDEAIIRIGMHELAHHILINHVKWVNIDNMHDSVFEAQLESLLNKYYNNKIPKDTIKELKREGLNVKSYKKN